MFHTDVEDAEQYGWRVDPKAMTHDWNTMVQGIRDHIGALNWGYRNDLSAKNVEYINGFATFEDPHTISYRSPEGTVNRLTADKIIIAVGGRPVYLDIPGAKENCVTSDDFFYLEKPPGKTLVVGASYVALECAGVLTHLGYDTTVMVRSILLRGFDTDMATRIGAYMERHGTKFIQESIPTRIDRLPSGQLQVTAQTHGVEVPIVDVYDTVLLAIGRIPNTHKLHLDRCGVAMDPRTGKIPCVNEQTNVPHIYCIGDALLGAPELTPTAILAGKLLAKRLYAQATDLINWDTVPTTVFTPIEYGSIGLSEERAIEKYGADHIDVFHTEFTPLEWTVARNRDADTDGCYAKLICVATENMRVVGFHYLGPNAGEVTNGFAVGMRLGATKFDFDMGIGIHPTCAETLNTLTITKRSQASAKKGGC